MWSRSATGRINKVIHFLSFLRLLPLYTFRIISAEIFKVRSLYALYSTHHQDKQNRLKYLHNTVNNLFVYFSAL